MNPPQKFLEIECPACHHIFYSKHTNQLECLYCKSIIEINKDKKVVNYEPPEYHGTAVSILSIISLFLLLAILGDALWSENTLDELIPIGIMIVMFPLLYFWIPIRYGYGRKYGRFGLIIGFTLVLILYLILNLGNFITK